MKIKKIAIIGVGLIGGSIGKALIKKGAVDEVIGICRRQSSLDRALTEKSVTKGFVNNYEQALNGVELVIISTPVGTIKKVLKDLSVCLNDRKILVTDVGSTKKEIVDFAEKYKDHFAFIGSHPLAGSEKTGVEASTDNLLENSVCVITPSKGSEDNRVEALKTFWESTGARVYTCLPEKHDEIIAFSSHLPHVVAFALSGVLEKGFDRDMFSTGFKDTTRIALSDAELWADIFMTNRDNLIGSIEVFREKLNKIENKVRQNDHDGLKKYLEDLKRTRNEYF